MKKSLVMLVLIGFIGLLLGSPHSAFAEDKLNLFERQALDFKISELHDRKEIINKLLNDLDFERKDVSQKIENTLEQMDNLKITRFNVLFKKTRFDELKLSFDKLISKKEKIVLEEKLLQSEYIDVNQELTIMYYQSALDSSNRIINKK